MGSRSMYTFMLLAAAMSAEAGIYPSRVFDNSKPKEPKNKYGLSPEQIALMEDMTPKEKKKFLRELKG